MSKWTRGFGLGIALCLLALPLSAQSQATTGVIEGVVVDANGESVPGASVNLTNTDTGFQRDLVTDSAGRFRGVLLPLGPYKLSASLEGFSTLVREGINLGLGETVRLRLPLQLSTVEQEIVVTAAAPLIEGSRTEGLIRIDDAAIEGLPNNGRNFLDFSKLTPGVTIVQGPDGEELSITGQKGINNNISVDGADFNNPFFGEQRGGQRPPFTFNIDAVKEVLIVTDGAPAEFGRSSGGFVNVVTKSGTNEMAGSAHLFFKNDSLSSSPQNRDGSRESGFDFDQTQYGFTLGGPLRQDKLFYFLAYDLQQGDETKQNDPGRIDPRLVSFFASLGAPNENGPISRTNDADVALGKLDWQPSQRNLVTLRGTYTFSEQENGTFDVNQWGTSANGIEKDYSHSFTTTVISTLSSSVLNEFRGQYAKEFRPRPYEGPTVPGQNRPFPDTAIAETGNRFGMPFFLPVVYDDDRTQLNDNISILKGNHSFKAGIEYNDVGSSQTFIGFANGRYIFSSVDGFINYFNNPSFRECSDGSTTQSGVCPAGSTATGPVLLFLQQAGVGNLSVEQAGTQTLEQVETSLFVQDQWQVTPSLTLELGLRYEHTDQPETITPAEQVFYADFIGQTVNTAAGPQRFPSDGGIPDDSVLQPRFALAWTPPTERRSVVRFNAGYYAARSPALTWASVRSTNGSRGQTLFRNSFLGDIGVLPNPPAWPNLIPQSEIGIPFFPDVFVADEDFELPKTISSALSWEWEAIEGYAFLFKVNYAKTDHITRWVNRNDPLLGSPWSSGLAPGGINGVSALNTVESTAKSRFRAYTVGVNKALTGNFQFQAYYTWSKDESDDDNERDPFTIRYAKVTDLEAEYGLSDRHQRHRFNAWMLWNAPAGVDINARFSYRDNQPLDVDPFGNPVGFPPAQRCIPAPPPGSNTCDPTADVFQRNQGEKDNEFMSLDVRLSRKFSVGNYTIEPVIDIFNLTDEENFLVPEVTNLAFNFDGTVRSGAGEPREIQVGVRFLF
ncbi:MAG TPA: TonB-dependent receptor [Thermoanaerobaculia bacterium]|nr:TonB-dependent receptor [Thermoanaerobaculia bacterium]